MAAQKLNPFVEQMLITLITTLSEAGAEILFQKIVDKNKKKAAIVLGTLKSAIDDVAANNGIEL